MPTPKVTDTKQGWLDDLESTLEIISPDGVSKSIGRYTAMFKTGGVTLAEAKAKLAIAQTRSGKAYVAAGVVLVYGSFLRSKFEGLSMTDAYTYASTLNKVHKQDFTAMEAEFSAYKTAEDVVKNIDTLINRMPKRIEVIQTPTSKFVNDVAALAAELKADGYDLPEALLLGAETIKAQWSK
jgi:hypothetical protein